MTVRKFTVLMSMGVLAFSDPPTKTLNPQVAEIVSQVSADRIADIQRKLESFGTRNIYSATDDPNHGIGSRSGMDRRTTERL